MRIIHVRPQLEVGGVSEYIIRLTEGLSERGHYTAVATAGGAWGERIKPIATYYPNLALSQTNVRNIMIAVGQLVRIVRQERIEIINTHHRFAALVGRITALITGVPYVTTMHEAKNDQPRMTRLGLANNVITISRMMQHHISESYHIDSRRIYVIPMGVTCPSPLSISEQLELIRQIGLQSIAPIVGCVGRLSQEKGQGYLVKAIPEVLQAHPSAQFVFVGDGPDRQHLEHMAVELGIGEKVTFLGRRDDVAQLMQLFDFTVVPSVEEGFGIVILESFANKKPVVATNVGGIPEIVKPGENGYLVPACDTNGLTTYMIKLLSDSEHRKQLGYNGYYLATSQFPVHRFVEETEKLYMNIIKAQHKHPST